MTRRSGQNGTVEKVIRKGAWVWRGRWLEDVPGLEGRAKRSEILGPASGEHGMTQPQAKRKLRELLDRKGINVVSYTVPIGDHDAGRTFAEVSIDWWN